MNRIRLLPDHVANQIAAGEVVERPASVVKELVENALDASATLVTVEIQAGGRSLIRVTDDGLGMSRDDALLSLERHATSKIRRAEDLAAIASMGFRGEALPSIASVSRFTLTTRERDSDSPEATRILINGGKMIEVKAAGAAAGTSVEVRQLFFNLPARRKFLRTEETEFAQIHHYMTLAASAFPEVAFQLHKDGRLLRQLPAVKTGPDIPARLNALRERLRALYGDEQRLVAVNFSASLADATPAGDPSASETGPEPAPSEASLVEPYAPEFRLWGYIGAPGVSRAHRGDQHLFVNRRPVENRGLNFALLEGYHTALMKGRYPVACLFLEIDPAAVDVNIHPAKREVKFHREWDVRRLVTDAIRQALLRYHMPTGAAISNPAPGSAAPKTETTASPQSAPLKAPNQAALPGLPAGLAPTNPSGRPGSQPPLQMGFAPPAEASVTPPTASRPSAPTHTSRDTGPQPQTDTPTTTTATQVQTGAATATPLLQVPLRLVGVIGKLYVLLESDRGLVLLDQHAAHERVLYEQMLNRIEQSGQAPSQRLLLPETVELSARDAAFIRDQLPALVRLGVGLSEFGERTFLLDALPPLVKATDAKRFVRELVDELRAAGQEVNVARLGEQVVAKTVCRHAVKANDPLTVPELDNLVRDLRHCALPYTCPHGRPTLIEMNYRELDRKFGRTT